MDREREEPGILPESATILPILQDAPVLGADVQVLPGGNLARPAQDVAESAGNPGRQLADSIPPLVEPAGLLSFFSVRPITAAMQRLGWTADREMELLTQIAEYSEEDSNRLRAMNEIRDRMREALETEGYLREMSVTETGDVGGRSREVKISGGLTNMLGDLAKKFAPPAAPATPKELENDSSGK